MSVDRGAEMAKSLMNAYAENPSLGRDFDSSNVILSRARCNPEASLRSRTTHSRTPHRGSCALARMARPATMEAAIYPIPWIKGLSSRYCTTAVGVVSEFQTICECGQIVAWAGHVVNFMVPVCLGSSIQNESIHLRCPLRADEGCHRLVLSRPPQNCYTYGTHAQHQDHQHARGCCRNRHGPR